MSDDKPKRGTAEWAAAAREEIRLVADAAETAYIRLAQALYEVHEMHVDDDKNKPRLFTTWGWKTFEEFVSGELKLQPGKAYALKRIWLLLETELKTLAPEMRLRLERLGWTRLRELARVVTLRNVKGWLEVAETKSYEELEALVKAYRKKAEEKAEAEKRRQNETVAGAGFQDPPAAQRGDGIAARSISKDAGAEPTFDPPPPTEEGDAPPAAEDRGDLVIADDDDVDPLMPISAADQVERRAFGLYPHQVTVIDEALELAEKFSGSDSKSYNLVLICTEYASHNVGRRHSRTVDQRVEILARFAKVLDLDVVAIDPKTDDVVYGSDVIHKILKEGSDDTGDRSDTGSPDRHAEAP